MSVSDRTQAAGGADRPDWGEAVVGLVVFAVIGFGGGAAIVSAGLDPVVSGLVLTAWSGLAGLAGFAAAAALRRRPLSGFGLRRTSVGWLLAGTGLGIVAFMLKGVAVIVLGPLFAQGGNPQSVYGAGAGDGVATLVMATFFLGVLTPLGEEFLFRGVVTNALLRFGAWVGVIGGALIFALMHGLNVVFPAALVAGLIAGEVFRRSGSVWPAVMVHVMFNLPTIPLMVLAGAAAEAA